MGKLDPNQEHGVEEAHGRWALSMYDSERINTLKRNLDKSCDNWL